MDRTTGCIALSFGLAIGLLIAKMLEKGKATNTLEGAKREAASILKDAKAAFPDMASFQALTDLAGRNGSLGGEVLKRFNMVVY